MIKEMKKKFAKTTDKDLKMKMLSVLPKSWSIRKLQREFSISLYMARKIKSKVKQKGVFFQEEKKNRLLPHDTYLKVEQFYESDEISRLLPGRKDFVSVKTNGSRKSVQKRLILYNLKDVHELFKSQHPEIQIGLTKFTQLRPKHCIHVGSKGTHNVCVCTIHENVKLMFGSLCALIRENDKFNSYHDLINEALCAKQTPQCHLLECKKCPGVNYVTNNIQKMLLQRNITSLNFKQWTNTDRSTIEVVSENTEKFLENLQQKLKKLIPHAFIALKQGEAMQNMKLGLKAGEFLVILDFSENYSFVAQNAAQSFHWNNAQVTIHPIVVYYIEDNIQKHHSFVIISDCLKHNTVAVHLFQGKLMDSLKKKFTNKITKIIYFSDGAASQYKNRFNFGNLAKHEEDFGVPASWQFSATSHGKGPSDGLGGTIKRSAYRSSLQGNLIMTPRQFFDYAVKHHPTIEFVFTTTEEHLLHSKQLQSRFDICLQLKGTQSYHSFEPKDNKIVAKLYSASKDAKDFKIFKL